MTTDPSPPVAATARRKPRRRRALLVCGAGAIAVAAIVWTLSVDDGPRSAPAATSGALAAVTVERRDLLTSQSVPGKLGYAGGRTLLSPAAGVVTALPSGGSIVRRGQLLLRVDGKPVVLLDGTVPLYRAMRVGTVGPDVRQLERNLHALGYDADDAIAVDDTFTGATATAVRRLQRRLGVTRTGVLDPALAVFLPAPRRIGAITAQLGARLAPGAPVMQTTSLRREVKLAIDAAQRTSVRRGERVTVTLPGGARRGGRIATVGRVARDKPQGQSTRTVVDLSVRLGSDRGLSGLEEAPVSVALTSTAARDVLVVPVTALRARPGRGYAVLVPAAAAAPRLLQVVPGRFSGGYVEISGAAIRAGMKVLVPGETI
jgi:peptidoglycan hydrolase-like protein with peptidoglycan-binding domain